MLLPTGARPDTRRRRERAGLDSRSAEAQSGDVQIRRDRRRFDPLSEKREGAGDPTSLLAPATLALSLPRFDSGVMRTITLQRGGHGLTRIAEALLDADMLSDSDWNGDLASSIEVGLSRWVNEKMGAETMAYLKLCLSYTDNISIWFDDPDPWVNYAGGEANLRVGAFAIGAEVYEEVFIERRVLGWEQLRPGLGYALFGLIQKALWTTIDAVTPEWALDDLESSEWGLEEEEEAESEELCYMTSSRLRKLVPAQALTPIWDEKLALKALRQRKNRLDSDERLLLQEAISLAGLVNAAYEDPAFMNQIGAFDNAESVLPIAVRWNEKDEINRVSDEYHDMLANAGTQTDVVFLQGFQVDVEGSVEKCLRNIRTALEIVIRTDRLLQALDGDNSLMKVFARERVKVKA